MSNDQLATKEDPRINFGRDNLLTTREAAKILRVHPGRVRQFCRAGRLGTRFGRAYMITRAELEKFKKIERPYGRPKNKPRKGDQP